ncbi:MAG: D-alanyl-D-alanine carboxypeptidase/D-alanyl-D-alanine-endopeptidase [Bacteroidales bacterium]|nr:D-alanyl-D-alanine carboxypeptidase/D-alanyl-D-alanine-endopeptidase [Bacteroidales bacterium]
MKLPLTTILIFSVFLSTIWGFKSSLNENQTQSSEIQTSIKALISKYALEKSMIGLHAKSLDNGDVYIAFGHDQLLTPASVQKLVTTSAAFKYLGKDYKLSTKVLVQGEISNGTLYGNLIIKGEGDATFESKYFEKHRNNTFNNMTVQLAAKGIQHVQGKIILDVSSYENQAEVAHWMWQDMGNYYGAAVYALNHNDNSFTIFFNSPAAGQRATISSNTSEINVAIDNYVKSYDGRSDNAYVYSSPYSNKIVVRGEIPQNRTNFKVKASQPNLLKSYGEALKKATGWNNEIEITENPAEGQLLFILESVPLQDIISATNQRSINLFAEQLFKHIAFYKYGIGSTEKGLTCISDYLKNLGISDKDFLLHDGSGLSPFNITTANTLTSVLSSVSQESYFADFKKTLAVPGENGTLKYFAQNKKWKSHVFAKTGTLSNSRSLAGYFTTSTGSQVAFVFIVNNFTIKGNTLQLFFEELLDLLYINY